VTRGVPARDGDGFAPIESYGVIGDGKSAALVAADGSIDWWAVPALDSPPLFAALLDPVGEPRPPAGGHFALEPTVKYRVERRYLPGTNVLETTFVTRGGTVRVTDSVNQGSDGRLPWGELVRDIHPVRGKVPMRWRVAPGTLFHLTRPWTRDDAPPLLHVGSLLVALVADGAGALRRGHGEFSGEFTARAGHDALLALVVADGAPVVVPSAQVLRDRLRRTESAWRQWTTGIPYDGPDADLVIRSVLALRLLTYMPTGAMTAAATTSLPERVGGERNYDYRYGWIRDTSFVLDSFIRLGLTQEVQGTLAWMLSCVAATAPDIHPFYGLRGHVPDSEYELRLRGYRGSRPVRNGNRAVGQPQWGNYGDLLECVWLAVSRAGAVLDPGSADLIVALANRVCDVWADPDCGIWELDERRRNTFSTAGCWVALDRALRLASAGQISSRDRNRWEGERAAIREWIDTRCWSPSRGAYLAYPESEDLDASLLLLGRTGFCSGEDVRFRSTIDAISGELRKGPLMYRLSGASSYEGAFVPASFWLIDALMRTGRTKRARELWREARTLVNDLGLLSEEIDPSTGEFLGNIPQGLSHLALVNAAVQLNHAGRE
jgi:GH15 family glucan-1,4-alpha-glucosidase